MRCPWLLLLFCLLLPPAARAEEEPPVIGRPPDFSGAVGSYRIRAEARPTEVQAGDPVTLTLTITGTAAANAPPRRLDLRPALGEQFQVDNEPDRDSHPDANTWEFVYRLRPRNPGATRIPRLKFIYYQPGVGYQQTYTAAAIPLTVRPQAQATEIVGTPGAAPLGPKYAPITGAAVLEHETPDRLPGPWLLALLFLAPPALCLAWYQLWCRWYPDAGRLARQRRSRAARAALKALRTAKGRPPAVAAARVTAALADYLRQRLNLTAEEPTPAEAAAHLEQAGASPALAGKWAALLRACDGVRFAPDSPSNPTDLGERAALLVRELEAELCACRVT